MQALPQEWTILFSHKLSDYEEFHPTTDLEEGTSADPRSGPKMRLEVFPFVEEMGVVHISKNF